tara:strand:- start:111 stop:446 length:336 start_codon:yes stop_codon:yes gene_type:complete
MKIYKTVFDTEEQGKEFLLNLGVLVESEGEIVFSENTAAVVNIGKVVEIPATYDADGNELTPPIYFPGWAYDIMSSDELDFGAYEVFPAPNEVHSFMGWDKDAEVPPTLEP